MNGKYIAIVESDETFIDESWIKVRYMHFVTFNEIYTDFKNIWKCENMKAPS